jgi:hypothetical protein
MRHKLKLGLLTLPLIFLFDSVNLARVEGYVLPDTGQITCYGDIGEIPCPSPGQAFYGQDGNYQGPQPAYLLSPDGLAVTDLNTGLMWQQADDGVERNWDDAVAYCENLSHGAYSDWRLPRRNELVSIVDYGRCDPATDPVFGGQPDMYWSGSTFAQYPENAWNAYLYNGSAYYYNKNFTSYVRCVRGWQILGEYVNNGNGTVTDTSTGLMWQQADDGQTRTWQEALSYCEGLNLAGQTGWRLPDIRELNSLVDDTRYWPTINQAFSSRGDFYWSGSTLAENPLKAWDVHFGIGDTTHYLKIYKIQGHFVRCVRGRPSGSLDDLALPISQHFFNVLATGDPVLNTDPTQAIPIGIGPVAVGGSILRLKIATAALSGPADIYLGVFMPDIDLVHVYILRPDLTFLSHLEGIFPWKKNVTGPLNETLFRYIPTHQLPPGTYHIYLAITPSGQGLTGGYYLWATKFEIP